MFNMISLIAGITAWIFGFWALTSKDGRRVYSLSVFSFSTCVIALISQMYEIGRRVFLNDYAAIEDTIRAVIMAAVVLVVVTIALNVVACFKGREKK